jgi:hypothetical protein
MLNPFRPRLGRSPDRPDPFLPRLETLEERAVPAIIGGTVYADLNTNGLFDPGEPGLPGATLQLRDSAGNPVATTTSGPQGQYQFTQRDQTDITPGVQDFTAIFAPTPTNASSTATVQQFDPTLGTLTSIDIIPTATLSSHVQLENLGPAGAFDADLSGTLAFQAPGVSGLSASPSTEVNANLAAFPGGNPAFSGPSFQDLGTTTLAGTFNQITLSDPGSLAAYTGTGNVNVNLNATAQTCACGPGNLLAMINTTVQGSFKVVYHYTPSSVLAPGKYTIVQTQPPAGYVPGLATSDNITPIPGSDQTLTIPVTLQTPNDVLPNNDWAELKAPTPPPDIAPPPPDTPPPPAVVVEELGKLAFFGW